MGLDYAQIGKRIAARRKELGLRQTEVCEKAGINDKYLSCIERATSIPSLEVVIRLAQALDTTPDFFLVGSARHESNTWQGTAELLRNMSPRKLELAKSFLLWLTDQTISFLHFLHKEPSLLKFFRRKTPRPAWTLPRAGVSIIRKRISGQRVCSSQVIS